MSGVDDLPEFLLARIAEDEAAASLEVGRRDVVLVGAFAPARVLAECEAKRHLLGLLNEVNEQGIPRLTIYTRDRIPRLLALPYADHLDYREEWRL